MAIRIRIRVALNTTSVTSLLDVSIGNAELEKNPSASTMPTNFSSATMPMIVMSPAFTIRVGGEMNVSKC